MDGMTEGTVKRRQSVGNVVYPQPIKWGELGLAMHTHCLCRGLLFPNVRDWIRKLTDHEDCIHVAEILTARRFGSRRSYTCTGAHNSFVMSS